MQICSARERPNVQIIAMQDFQLILVVVSVLILGHSFSNCSITACIFTMFIY